MNNNQPVAYSRLVDVFHQVERLPGQQGVDAHLYCVFIRGTAPTRSRGTGRVQPWSAMPTNGVRRVGAARTAYLCGHLLARRPLHESEAL